MTVVYDCSLYVYVLFIATVYRWCELTYSVWISVGPCWPDVSCFHVLSPASGKGGITGNGSKLKTLVTIVCNGIYLYWSRLVQMFINIMAMHEPPCPTMLAITINHDGRIQIERHIKNFGPFYGCGQFTLHPGFRWMIRYRTAGIWTTTHGSWIVGHHP